MFRCAVRSPGKAAPLGVSYLRAGAFTFTLLFSYSAKIQSGTETMLCEWQETSASRQWESAFANTILLSHTNKNGFRLSTIFFEGSGVAYLGCHTVARRQCSVTDTRCQQAAIPGGSPTWYQRGIPIQNKKHEQILTTLQNLLAERNSPSRHCYLIQNC